MSAGGRLLRDLLRLGQTAQWRGWLRVNDLPAVDERPDSNEAGLPPLAAPPGSVCSRCGEPLGGSAARTGARGDWRHDVCPS